MREAFSAVWDHLVPEDPPQPCDAILCFGSRHWRVPERAAALWDAGVAPVIAISGGPSAPGEVTEADRFARELIRRGVPTRALVLERTARHTGENAVLGLEALREATSEPIGSVTLVSWPLAARRCRATTATVAPDLQLRSAPALPAPGHRWAPTPRRIRFALGELDRLHRYHHHGHLDDEAIPDHVQEAAHELHRHLAATGELTAATAAPPVGSQDPSASDRSRTPAALAGPR